MENKPSDKRSNMPLDKVLYQVAKIEHDSGEPDKIWKITDIDDLIASTDADSTALDYDDDDELLMSIAYYKNRYSDDDISSEYETIYTDPKEPESEPDEEPEPEEAEPENPADEPEASAEAETEEPAEPAESDEAEQTVENKEPVSEVSFAKPEKTESAGESYFTEPESEAATEAPAEPEEAEAAQESADEIEPEAEEVKAEEVPADESEDIYSDSKIELSVVKADGEDDDIQESEPKDEVDTDESNKTDESDNSDNILTLHGEEEESEDEDEAEKKPTVEELFGAPASRYFGEPTEEPEEDSERESRAIPGLFGDTVVFGPMKSLSEPTRNKPDDEYKTKLMTAIGSAKAPQSAETIEKPGVILKRGPLSETSGLEPLPQVIPAEEFVGSGDDKPASIEDQPFTNPAAGNQPEEEQMMLSGFGE